MKKGFKITTAAALAVSALTPVAAFAAETTLETGYYSDSFTSVKDFSKLTTSEKKAFFKANLKKENFIFVVDGKVLDFKGENAERIMNAVTDEEFLSYATTVAAYEKEAGVTVGSEGIVKDEVESGDLKVESVSAINAREIAVTFNNKVNAASAINAANYEFVKNTSIQTAAGYLIANTGAVGDGKEGLLSTDGKTVTFRLAAPLTNSDKYAVHVKNAVLDENLKQGQKYEDNAKTFADSQAPTLTKAEVVAGSTSGQKRVRLTFNEPIAPGATGYTVIIDGTQYSTTTNPYPGIGKYTVETANIVDTNDIFKVGTHTVVVQNASDQISPNPNVNTTQTLSYTVSNDTVAPTVQSVQPINSRSFRVVFSEALSVLPTLTVQKGTHTFTNATGAANPGEVQIAADPDVRNAYVVSITEEAVSATNKLWTTNDTAVTLSVKLEGYKDSANLIGQTVTQSVTLNKDTLTPKAVANSANSIAVIGGTDNLVVKFNGKLDNTSGAVDASKIVVRNKDGVIVHSGTVTAAVDGTDATKLNISTTGFSPAYSSSQEPYTVEFKAEAVRFAKDTTAATYSVNTNKNTTFTTTVSATPTASPLAVKTDSIISSVTSNKITISYGEDMDASAKVLANYKINNAALPAGTTIDFVGGNQVVVITLPEGSYSTTTDAVFEISTNVKTKNLSSVVVNAQSKNPVSKVLTFADNKKPSLEKAEYLVVNGSQVETDRIKVTFDEKLAPVSDTSAFRDDFLVAINGVKQTVSKVEDVTVNDNYIILTLGTKVNVSQTANISIVAEGTQNATINITDIATNKVATDKSVATLAAAAIDVDKIAADAGNQAALDQAAAQGIIDAATATSTTNVANVSTVLSSATGLVWTKAAGATVSGTVTDNRPAYGTAATTVTYVATATVNGKTATKNFTVNVPAKVLDVGSVVSTPASVTTANGSTTFTVALQDTAGVAITGLTSTNFTFTPGGTKAGLLGTITVVESATPGTYNVTVPTTAATSADDGTATVTIKVDGTQLTTEPTVTIVIP